LRFSTKDLEASLREAGGATLGSAGQHSRNLLVVAQMALTLILLVGAGLLGKSFYRLLQIDPGFHPESAVAMELSLPDSRADEGRYKKLMEAYELLMKRGEAPAENTKFTED